MPAFFMLVTLQMLGLAEPEIALYRGDKLGARYELQEFLGEGHVSFVFKVLDTSDEWY